MMPQQNSCVNRRWDPFPARLPQPGLNRLWNLEISEMSFAFAQLLAFDLA